MVTSTTGAGSSPVATSSEQADAMLQRLHDRANAWAQVPIPQRIAYLKRCIDGVMAVAQPWADAACRAKGIDPTSALAGEEWFVGPAATIANLQQLIRSLKAKGKPKPPKVTRRKGSTRSPQSPQSPSPEQTIAQVFPDTLLDKLAWAGLTAEVWMEPGKPIAQGQIYRTATPGQVALVLGAGNISSIGPMDALYKLFAENAVVLLKMNPVNAYVGPFLEQAFQPLRQDGFFEVVYGGADLGEYLCQHPQVDSIHITGSHHTHDAIVWGSTPEEQADRKASQQPRNPKPITSELGCVTPVLVVPGDWSEEDLGYHARQVAGMVAHNASFNCAAAKVLVTAKGWDLRDRFLDLVYRELIATPPRIAYYPGARQRYDAFLERYPQAQPVSTGSDDIIPWTLIPDVPAVAGEYALTQEAFCGVLAEVSLDAIAPDEFLQQAVPLVNEVLWGNLSVMLLVDPATQKRWATEVEQAIADLRYGAIALNVWSALAYAFTACTWGAFPGNPLSDIQSGRGVVHNTYLFEYPQKSVVRGPFRINPTPTWFPRHSNLLEVAKQFTELQAKPSVRTFFRLARSGMKS